MTSAAAAAAVANIYMIQDNENSQIYVITLRINNYSMDMEYDTGALRSIINRTTWQRFGSPSLSHLDDMNAYPCQPIHMLGTFMVDVTCGGATKRLPLAVVDDDTATPLCGRNWVHAFNLGPKNSLVKLRDFTPDVYSISRPNVKINANSNDITGLINEFSDVINNNLSKEKGYKAIIILRDDAIPVVFRPRPVPFDLHKAADQELDRLIKADIIEPVDPITTQINWAMHICA